MTTAPQPAATPKRRRLQFSLRTMLLGTAVAGVLLDVALLWVVPAQRQRAAVQMVERVGGRAFYVDAPADESWAVAKLRNWLPRDYFDDVVRVDLNSSQVTDAELVYLKGLTAINILEIRCPQVTDAGLVHLKRLTTLEWLDLGDTQVSAAWVGALKDAMPNCVITEPYRDGLSIEENLP